MAHGAKGRELVWEKTDIRHQDLRAVGSLQNELAELQVNHADEALGHCLQELARILGAGNACWVGAARTPSDAAQRDQLQGWRPKAVQYLHPDTAQDRIVVDVVSRLGSDADPMTRGMVAHAGRTRAFLRHELVNDETWDSSWLVNEALRPRGIKSRMIGAHTVDASTESYVFLDRHDGDKPFGPRERDLLYMFLLGGAAFHRQQVLARMMAHPPLTPRERDVLALLLTERSEREIGEELGLTWRTTHQHVVAILRKYGVRGRVGLMALWLRGGTA